MLTFPSIISMLRMPLALVFLQENPAYRAAAIILAMITDVLDGYFARKYCLTTPLGTLLDPLMDKFFVFFSLGILFQENRLYSWEAIAMLGRDFSVIAFGFYLAFKKRLSTYQFRAIWCGKVSTALQFTVLIGLTFHLAFPAFVYISFMVIGLCALLELYFQSGIIKAEG